jgi:hypothetical protein
MKKKAILIISLFVFHTMQAQTVKDIFISLPESILPDLSSNARLDLIDLYEAGREAHLLNSFEDSVSIEKLTQDYLLLKSGKNSFQLIVLQMINESKLYCIIHTVCAPLCDSRMEFYSVSGNKLDSGIFFPSVDQTSLLKEKEGFPAPDISLVQLTYDAETSTLHQTGNTFKNQSMEDQERNRQNIQNENREYKWNGIRFE